ncbi:MAG: hypothetical protein AAGB29_09250 [Planctomycetota bacterium]
MSQRSLLALIVVNAVLLAGLVAMLTAPRTAEAQFAGASQYLMISGVAAGRQNNAAIYIIDLTNGAIAPVFVSTANDSLEVMTGRVVTNDTRRRTGGGSGGGR